MAQERNPEGIRIMRVQITFGASGAVVMTPPIGMGLSDTTPPVQSANPGQYTVTLERPVPNLIGFMQGWQRASSGAAPLRFELLTNNITNGILVFECKNSSGTLTNPASGDKLFLSLALDETGMYR